MTAYNGGIPADQSDSDERAERAFALHAALLRGLREDPALINDELFHVFRAETFERFNRALGETE